MPKIITIHVGVFASIYMRQLQLVYKAFASYEFPTVRSFHLVGVQQHSKSYSLLPLKATGVLQSSLMITKLCSKLAQTILSTHEERMQRKSREETSASHPHCHWYWPYCFSSASQRAVSKDQAVDQFFLKPKKGNNYNFKKGIKQLKIEITNISSVVDALASAMTIYGSRNWLEQKIL